MLSNVPRCGLFNIETFRRAKFFVLYQIECVRNHVEGGGRGYLSTLVMKIYSPRLIFYMPEERKMNRL